MSQLILVTKSRNCQAVTKSRTPKVGVIQCWFRVRNKSYTSLVQGLSVHSVDVVKLLLLIPAEYGENQPTRKLMQAAGKEEGDASIFPSKTTAQ